MRRARDPKKEVCASPPEIRATPADCGRFRLDKPSIRKSIMSLCLMNIGGLVNAFHY